MTQPILNYATPDRALAHAKTTKPRCNRPARVLPMCQGESVTHVSERTKHPFRPDCTALFCSVPRNYKFFRTREYSGLPRTLHLEFRSSLASSLRSFLRSKAPPFRIFHQISSV